MTDCTVLQRIESKGSFIIHVSILPLEYCISDCSIPDATPDYVDCFSSPSLLLGTGQNHLIGTTGPVQNLPEKRHYALVVGVSLAVIEDSIRAVKESLCRAFLDI